MKQASAYKPYIVVFTAALFYLFEFINMNSFNAFNDQLRTAFHVTALQVSNLSAMYFYANVLFLIPTGLLLDRVSTRRFLSVAFILCILMAFIFANTQHFWVACVCRFVTGMGSTLVVLSCVLLTARWVPPTKAGLVIGGVVTMGMFGGVLAQQITWLMVFLGSWRLAVVAIAVLGIFFLILVLNFVEDYPADYQAKMQSALTLLKKGFWLNCALAFKNKQIWYAGLYASLIDITVMVLGALWGKDYLLISRGFTEVEAATAMSMIFFGFMVGAPLFGLISDRMQRRKMPMIIGGILNLVWMLLILGWHTSPLLANFLFFVLGALCASQVLIFPLIIESVPRHITAISEAIAATLIMGGAAVFQLLFGWLLDHFATHPGQYTAHEFNQAIWLLPLAFIIASGFALLLKETYCQAFNQKDPS